MDKIKNGTPIWLSNSDHGIIDFLTSYGYGERDDKNTPTPINYYNGRLFSDSDTRIEYLLTTDNNTLKKFFNSGWYVLFTTKNWNNFCKSNFEWNSLKQTLNNIEDINSIANWEDFKKIVITAFIPLTNIRYCEFTINGPTLSDSREVKKANVFLTDDSILGLHTAYDYLFMNNRQEDKKVITTISEFIQYGKIEGELNTISENAGEGKVIKSGWDGDSDESLNKLLSCCVKALNTIRTDLSCTFTDEIYDLTYKMVDPATYLSSDNTQGVTVNPLVSIDVVQNATYTFPSTFDTSPLSHTDYPTASYKLKPTYTLDKWYYYNIKTNTLHDKSRNSKLVFSKDLLPCDIIVGIYINETILHNDPQFKFIGFGEYAPPNTGHGPHINNGSTFRSTLASAINDGVITDDILYTAVGFTGYDEIHDKTNTGNSTIQNNCNICSDTSFRNAYCHWQDGLGTSTHSSRCHKFVFLPTGKYNGTQYTEKWKNLRALALDYIKTSFGDSHKYDEHYPSGGNLHLTPANIKALAFKRGGRGYYAIEKLCVIDINRSTTSRKIKVGI